MPSLSVVVSVFIHLRVSMFVDCLVVISVKLIEMNY